MHRIIHAEALPVRLHNVAGKTKLGALGMFQLRCSTEAEAQKRQCKQHEKGHYFPAAARSDSRAEHKNADQKNAEHNKENDQRSWRGHNVQSPQSERRREKSRLPIYLARLRMYATKALISSAFML